MKSKVNQFWQFLTTHRTQASSSLTAFMSNLRTSLMYIGVQDRMVYEPQLLQTWANMMAHTARDAKMLFQGTGSVCEKVLPNTLQLKAACEVGWWHRYVCRLGRYFLFGVLAYFFVQLASNAGLNVGLFALTNSWMHFRAVVHEQIPSNEPQKPKRTCKEHKREDCNNAFTLDKQ